MISCIIFVFLSGFLGHRGGIRGLVFRKKKHTLYSCSDDKSIRIWCCDAWGYVESLFGHQDSESKSIEM
jgi:ribosomal RNA-processing protein 9